MIGNAKLFSIAIAACRHFSSSQTAGTFFRKKWGNKDFSYKNNKKKPFPTKTTSKAPKRLKVTWTDEQKLVVDAVCEGKSVFLTGSAGTGKSFLLQHVINKLKKIHGRSRVYVTAPTGVAACALNGQTLHSFAGVGLADVGRKELLERVLLDRHACSRWKRVKALCIDEISMVDSKLFDDLSYIARNIRSNNGDSSVGENKTWGGIQLIVCGDFFQLPPVLKKPKKAQKIYAFQADCWDTSFDLQIQLTKVFRQSDALLIQLLQKIRTGESDLDDLKLLEGCCSGSEPDSSAVQLYPRIEDVSRINREKMECLNSQIYTYKAEDLGDNKWIKQLNSGIAPDNLELCVGARVMLIKNVNPWRKLVNGATGTVTELYEVSDKQYELSNMCGHGSVLPLVKFDSGLELVVEPETWVVMDGDNVVARRRQIPLILSWALSIHKCQGMTLDKLHTDVFRAFGFGMVYVALSRVRSLSGLQLSGLDLKRIRAHPKVLEFYSSFNQRLLEGKNGNAIDNDDDDDGSRKHV